MNSHYEQPLGTLRVQYKGSITDRKEDHIEAQGHVPQLLRAKERLQCKDLRYHHANGDAYGAADAEGTTLGERCNLAVVHGQGSAD